MAAEHAGQSVRSVRLTVNRSPQENHMLPLDSVALQWEEVVALPLVVVGLDSGTKHQTMRLVLTILKINI